MQTPWPRARFLTERSPGDPGTPAAQERLDEWRSTVRLDEAALVRRLAGEGLDLDHFRGILGAAEDPVDPDVAPPEWWTALERLFAGWRPPPADPGPDLRAAVSPFVAHALDRLVRAVPAAGRPELAWPHLVPALAADLADRLLGLARRTLLLDLHVCRLQGRLQGEDPATRFADYVKLLLASPTEWRRLLGDYPVLARLLVGSMDGWVAHHASLLGRLREDWDLIRRDLLPADGVDGADGADRAGGADWLLEIRDARSDPHHGGQTVALLAFGPTRDAGPARRLVYKPRSLGPEAGFAELVTWFDARLPPDLPALRAARALDRGGYGWMEHVSAEPCRDREAVARFHRRQGMFLALLHAVRASDLHEENLIASGEHPVYVDLEVLFRRSPRPRGPADAAEAAERALAESVLSVGLLPRRIGGPGGINPGGLGDGQVQRSARPAPVVVDSGTDQMRMEQRTVTLPVGENQPRLGDAAQSVGDYADELEAGFLAARAVLARHRGELLAEGGLVDRLARLEVRHVVRPTALYTAVLRDGAHPDNLGDALDRERLADLLWSIGAEDESLWRVVPAERADLLRGDVPRFTTRADSRDLWTGRGERVPDHFPDDAVGAVRDGLLALGPDEDERQRLVIRATLESAVTVARPPRRGAAPRGPGAALDLARSYGELLLRHAVVHGDQATWLGMTVQADETPALAPVGPDLYAGDAGIALFLAWLGELAGEERYTAVARAAWRSAVSRPADPRPIGAYEGALSVRWAGDLLEALWGAPLPGPTLPDLLPACEGAVEQDHSFDLMSGSAGAILAVLALGGPHPDARVLALADRCAAHLAAKAIAPASEEVAWPRPRGGAPLLGFSHGVAGVAAALLRLARLDRPGAAGWRELALGTLAYERRMYDPARRNWPDLRGEPRFMSAWCHGAPGIVLSRAFALDQLDDFARDEVEAGVATTLAAVRGGSHSLCHGDVGNLLIVHRVARRLEREDWLAAVAAKQEEVLAGLAADGPRCGVSEAAATPGLMPGLAGVGLGLLYLLAPERVPFLLAPGS